MINTLGPCEMFFVLYIYIVQQENTGTLFGVFTSCQEKAHVELILITSALHGVVQESCFSVLVTCF